MSTYYDGFLSLLQPKASITFDKNVDGSIANSETESEGQKKTDVSEKRDAEDNYDRITNHLTASMLTLQKTLSGDFDALSNNISKFKPASFEQDGIAAGLCADKCVSETRDATNTDSQPNIAVIDRLTESMASTRLTLKYDTRKVISVHDATGHANKNGVSNDKVLRYHHELLVETKKRFGPEHPEVAEVQIGLASILKKKLMADDSLNAFGEALKIYENASTDRSCDRDTKRSLLMKSVETLNQIGNVYVLKGNMNKAIEQYRKALFITKNTIPDIAQNCHLKMYLPKTVNLHRADTLNNIASVYAEQGKFMDALQYHNLSLEMQEKYLGKEDVAIADTLNMIGIVEFKKKNYEPAVKVFKKVLRIRKKLLGSDHESVSDVLNNIGLIYSIIEEYECARNSYLEALRVACKVLGRHHVKVADIYGNIGFLAENFGDKKEAHYHLSKARKIYKVNGLSDYHTFVIAVTRRDRRSSSKSPRQE